MTFVGVPILDWVLLLVLLGFGVEAYVTTRTPASAPERDTPQEAGASDAAPRDP